MFLEQNLQALLVGDPVHQPLVEMILRTPAAKSPECQLITVGLDAQYSLGFQGFVLHNPDAPEQEARDYATTHTQAKEKQVHLILGMGLGYLPVVTFQHSPGRIVVWEPEPGLLRFVLENVDLAEILASGRIWLATEKNDALFYTRQRLPDLSRLDVLCLPGEGQRLASRLPGFERDLQIMRQDFELDYRTAENFHPVWLQNFFLNLPHIVQAQPVQSLEGYFTGQPAIIVSRGPSLDNALTTLKTLSGSAVIIAVGGALRPLWNAGIAPDFALFYDVNGMAEQLHGLPDEYLAQINFVSHPCSQAASFTSPSKQLFYFWTPFNKQIAAWLAEVGGTPQPLLEGGGGSVSIIALRLAQLLGCNPLVLLGQDLAYPNNQAYAGGIPLQTDEQGNLALPKTDTLYTETEAMTTVLGQHGETLPAHHAFPGAIRQLERIALENGRSQQPAALYNASLGGAQIDGFTLRPLEAWIDVWPPQYREKEQSLPRPAQPLAPEKLQNALGQLRKSLREAEALCEELLHKLADQGRKGRSQDVASLMGLLQRYAELMDRPGNAFLAYIPAFEMLRYRRIFVENTTNQTQETLPRLREEIKRLFEHSQKLFVIVREALTEFF